jgi:3-oxoacyl-[acyl-carrier protein] reductase
MAQGPDRRSVVITGGAGGIGRALARRFLAAGASVFLADCSEDSLEAAGAELGQTTGLMRCDVTSERDCMRLVELAEAHAGRPIDVLVTNAGVPFAGALRDASAEEISRVITVNVVGTILSARAAIDSLARGTDPCLLLMGSLQSITGRAGRSVYTASKHAVAGLARSLALELGPLGIRVNALAPTVLDTPFLHEAYARAGVSVEAGLREAARALPLGRIPTVDDVAETAFFLASRSAAAITGQVVMIDGGASAGKF